MNLKPPSGTKPPLTLAPLASTNYIARGVQYGAEKYRPGNWLLAGHAGVPGYLDAAMRHISAVAEDLERRRAAGALLIPTLRDADSGLPHLVGAIASLAMAIQLAVNSGALPADPGTPWRPND